MNLQVLPHIHRVCVFGATGFKTLIKIFRVLGCFDA